MKPDNVTVYKAYYSNYIYLGHLTLYITFINYYRHRHVFNVLWNASFGFKFKPSSWTRLVRIHDGFSHTSLYCLGQTWSPAPEELQHGISKQPLKIFSVWESELCSAHSQFSLTASFVCVDGAIWAHNALLSCRAFISQIIRVFCDTGELPEHVYRTGARFL